MDQAARAVGDRVAAGALARGESMPREERLGRVLELARPFAQESSGQ